VAPGNEPDTPQKHRHPTQSISSSLGIVLPRLLGAVVLMSFVVLLTLKAAAPRLSLGTASPAAAPDTLVLYMFSNTEPAYIGNLEYFVREAVLPDAGGQDALHRAHYIIIVQVSDDISSIPLPELPPNARYVYHRNQVRRTSGSISFIGSLSACSPTWSWACGCMMQHAVPPPPPPPFPQCYDWGTHGWLLRSGAINVDRQAAAAGCRLLSETRAGRGLAQDVHNQPSEPRCRQCATPELESGPGWSLTPLLAATSTLCC
jgi:hypothetical protein